MASIGILDLIEKNPPKVALTNYDICIIMSSIDFWRFTERRQRDKRNWSLRQSPKLRRVFGVCLSLTSKRKIL